MNKVHSTIKRLRLEKNMNQEQLAEELHVTRQAISNWENGKTQPDIETLTKIAELFGVSVEYLIYGKEIKTEEGVVKRSWSRGNFRFSISFFPERAVMWGMILATVVSYVNWKSIG